MPRIVFLVLPNIIKTANKPHGQFIKKLVIITGLFKT
jgi:hypothetical protein